MLDINDRTILNILRRRARETLTNISKETGLSIASVFKKVIKLRKRAIIRYASLLDFYAMGYSIRTFLIVPNTPANLRQLKSCSQINNLSITNKGLIAEAVFSICQRPDLACQPKEYLIIEEIKNQDFLLPVGPDTSVRRKEQGNRRWRSR